MWVIKVFGINHQGDHFALTSKKKWASYDDARKNLDNYIETVQSEKIVTDYYITGAESDED